VPDILAARNRECKADVQLGAHELRVTSIGLDDDAGSVGETRTRRKSPAGERSKYSAELQVSTSLEFVVTRRTCVSAGALVRRDSVAGFWALGDGW
jgi:hypothetical protein